jgi:Winged helix DNA-binding domain
MDRLSERQLNRATLHRQLLLHRAARPARDAIEHLAGLQAQAPLAPYVGLRTRLARFGHDDLKDLLTERTVVRAHLMRNTVHLMTATDFLRFRPLFQPLMERALAGNFGRNLDGVDLAELRALAQTLLAGTPLTRTQLADQLSTRWPGHDPASLAYAATHLLPLVQAPPRGLWGSSGRAAFVLASAWLADPQPGDPRPGGPSADGPTAYNSVADDPARAAEQLVLRYLAAYGPASVGDVQTWCGLSRLRAVTERLRPQLCVFTGPSGAELLDLPDAPRPDADVPAPPRFLPEYDNLLLSFADRGRVIRGARPVPLPPGNGATTGTLLIDGFWEGEWTITRDRDRAVLEVRPHRRLNGLEQDAITAEGSGLLEFTVPAARAAPAARTAPSAGHDVRITPVS